MPNAALKFGAATTDALNCGAATSGTPLFALDPMTVFMWVYPTTLTSGTRLAQTGNTTSRKQYTLSGTTGNIQAQINRTANSTYVTSDTPLGTLSKWKFLAMAYRSSANPAQAIYHGDLHAPAVESTYGTATDGSGGTIGEIDGQFCIGNLNGSTVAFVGSISTVAVANHYASLTDARYWQKKLLDRYWRPDLRWGCKFFMQVGRQANGAQYDLSGNGLNGTITGATPNLGPWGRPGRSRARFQAGSVVSGGAAPTLHRRTWFNRTAGRGVPA